MTYPRPMACEEKRGQDGVFTAVAVAMGSGLGRIWPEIYGFVLRFPSPCSNDVENGSHRRRGMWETVLGRVALLHSGAYIYFLFWGGRERGDCHFRNFGEVLLHFIVSQPQYFPVY